MTTEELTACCGSTAWVEQMAVRQPFADVNALHSAAEAIWWSLTPDDWLEAFAQHPKIGEKSAAKWCADEQSGMRQAAAMTAEAMLGLNAAYQERFGFIFIVCASGKSAEEMLASIRHRLQNGRAEEIQIAAGEQAKITRLRLEKLLTE